MRLIDADKLLNKTIKLEAEAREQVVKNEPLDNPKEWHIWNGVLAERTAFKYDLLDAPTVDAEIVKHGHWVEARYPLFTCSECGATYQDTGYGYNYCPNCGANMDKPVK